MFSPLSSVLPLSRVSDDVRVVDDFAFASVRFVGNLQPDGQVALGRWPTGSAAARAAHSRFQALCTTGWCRRP